MEFSTEVEENNLEDGYTIVDEIALLKEYLETQKEDLYWALQSSKLLEVTVEETEHYTEPDFVPNYSI